ncbi:MAG: hypothetical protein ACR5K2_04870 [Wolbachia sp.]
MCNFCKISYGSNDEKLDSKYKIEAELINEGYSIIPFCYNERNKKCAGFIFIKDKEITIVYCATKDFDDVMIDVSTARLPKNFYLRTGKYMIVFTMYFMIRCLILVKCWTVMLKSKNRNQRF